MYACLLCNVEKIAKKIRVIKRAERVECIKVVVFSQKLRIVIAKTIKIGKRD